MTFWVVCVAEVRASKEIDALLADAARTAARARMAPAAARQLARGDKVGLRKRQSAQRSMSRQQAVQQAFCSRATGLCDAISVLAGQRSHVRVCVCVTMGPPHRFSRHGTVEWSRRQERRIGLANSTRA